MFVDISSSYLCADAEKSKGLLVLYCSPLHGAMMSSFLSM